MKRKRVLGQGKERRRPQPGRGKKVQIYDLSNINFHLVFMMQDWVGLGNELRGVWWGGGTSSGSLHKAPWIKGLNRSKGSEGGGMVSVEL